MIHSVATDEEAIADPHPNVCARVPHQASMDESVRSWRAFSCLSTAPWPALTRTCCEDEQAVIDHYETPQNVGSLDKKDMEGGGCQGADGAALWVGGK